MGHASCGARHLFVRTNQFWSLLLQLGEVPLPQHVKVMEQIEGGLQQPTERGRTPKRVTKKELARANPNCVKNGWLVIKSRFKQWFAGSRGIASLTYKEREC